MNMRAGIRRFDQKLHQWEHRALLTSEKLMHEDTLWLIVVTLFIIAGVIFLTIAARGGDSSINQYVGPFGPYYPYGR